MEANNKGIADCVMEEVDTSKNVIAIEGIQETQNPNTVANSTREVFISCARIAPWLFAALWREGTMPLLCCLTTR